MQVECYQFSRLATDMACNVASSRNELAREYSANCKREGMVTGRRALPTGR